MRDRELQHRARFTEARKRRRPLDAHINAVADEVQARIAGQRARQEARFAEQLKTVTDTEHQAASVGKTLYGAHHRAKRRHRPAPQIVAIRKPAG